MLLKNFPIDRRHKRSQESEIRRWKRKFGKNRAKKQFRGISGESKAIREEWRSELAPP
jgi:hypothetical protein